MQLRGQAGAKVSNERGYAMAALLVTIGIMSLMLSVVMPSWRHAMQREKEAELVFRGEQYARAVGLFQRKFAGAFPPNIDLLVDQKFLRRKYRDPMAEDGEFLILYQTTQAPGAGTGVQTALGARPGAQTAPGGIGQAREPTSAFGAAVAGGTQSGMAGRTGVIGVASKSKEQSIRLYEGRSRYDQWQFVYTAVSTQAGVGPTAPRPGQPVGSGAGVPGMGEPRQRPGGLPTPGAQTGSPFGTSPPRRPGQPPR